MKSEIYEAKDIWSRIEEIKDWRSQRIEEVKDLKFGDSARVYNSSRVSGATDMGIPIGNPRIIIPGPAHYGGGLAQGLEDWLGDEEGRF
jgi:hypothetical protein